MGGGGLQGGTTGSPGVALLPCQRAHDWPLGPGCCAGKHVLSEKPVAPTLEQAQQLLAFYRSLPSPAPLWCVGENYRQGPGPQLAHSFVRAGRRLHTPQPGCGCGRWGQAGRRLQQGPCATPPSAAGAWRPCAGSRPPSRLASWATWLAWMSRLTCVRALSAAAGALLMLAWRLAFVLPEHLLPYP